MRSLHDLHDAFTELESRSESHTARSAAADVMDNRIIIDLVEPPPAIRREHRPRRRWIVPALVAATILAVAISLQVSTHRTHSSGIGHGTENLIYQDPSAQAWIRTPLFIPTGEWPTGEFSVSHPPAWTIYQYPTRFGFRSVMIAYVSTDELHNPCNPTHCADQPLTKLSPSGVLIQWFVTSGPPIEVTPKDFTTKIDGHLARIVDLPGEASCKRIGGVTLLSGQIVLDQTGGEQKTMTYFNACLGPDNLATNRQAFQRMFNSIQLP
jgi:hypothetical protein